MVLSRFWFGWWGVKLIAIFNVIACIGWSSVNSIVGAQLINTVNTDVPGWAGVLIIAFCTFGITLFGYKVVHAYEFWSWIPTFIVFLIVLGVFAHTGDFYNIPWETGKSELGAMLSFGSTVYGFATGWTSYAADYTVRLRSQPIAIFCANIIPRSTNPALKSAGRFSSSPSLDCSSLSCSLNGSASQS